MRLCLAFLVFVTCYPVLFLLTGTLMDGQELMDCFTPLISDSGGSYVSWRLIPTSFSLRMESRLLVLPPASSLSKTPLVTIRTLLLGKAARTILTTSPTSGWSNGSPPMIRIWRILANNSLSRTKSRLTVSTSASRLSANGA